MIIFVYHTAVSQEGWPLPQVTSPGILTVSACQLPQGPGIPITHSCLTTESSDLANEQNNCFFQWSRVVDGMQYHCSELEYIYLSTSELLTGASLIAQLVKNPPAMQETPIRFLGWVGEEMGYPLQYSDLENSMDRGARQAMVHGVCSLPSL